MLNRDEQRALLVVALGAVERAVLDGISAYRGCPLNTPTLALPAAAFVTLRVAGELRGKSGNVRPRQALPGVIHENAVAAATRDSRFEPIGPREVESVAVEISVLTPAQPDGNPFIPLRDLKEIEIGRDGLYLELADGRSGLLLPQVAAESRMDGPQFLEALRHRAGAPSNAWMFPGAFLARFQAQVFGNS